MISAQVCCEELTKLHITEAGDGQAFLLASVPVGVDAELASWDAYTKIANVLDTMGMVIVHERLFGSLSVEPKVMAARGRAFNERNISADSPVTYIQGHPPWGEGLAGVIIRAVKSTGASDEQWTIMDGNIPCGKGWRRNGTTFLTLQNIQGLEERSRHSNTPVVQARRMIKRAECILKEQGLSYRDVVRTWFYLADILKWYGDFNKVRNAKYDVFGIMPRPDSDRLLLPASTGIQGITPQGSFCTMDLLATTMHTDNRPIVLQMTNTEQKDAFRYGSAFSRGAFIEEPDVSLIEVSGTAAIDKSGVSLYQNDIRAQINCTLDKIEALLDQKGARLDDICAATVFVKRPEYAEVYREMARARGLNDLPCVCVVTDICRDDLLFEVDAEVALPRLWAATRPGVINHSSTTAEQCTILPLHRNG